MGHPVSKTVAQNASSREEHAVLRNFHTIPLSDVELLAYSLRPVLPARFMKRLRMEANGCWQWTGSTCGLPKHRYGQIRIGSLLAPQAPSGRVTAHRFAYWIVRGPIPNGLEPDHVCENKLCVNPSHLELVTHRENSYRRKHRGEVRPPAFRHGHKLAFDREPIREMYRSGLSLSEISARTGIRYLYVWRAVNGRKKGGNRA